MTEIPTHLQNPNFRFILLKGKVPFEHNWQTTNNYGFDDPKLLDWISKGGNVGVVCGYGNLIGIDFDDLETYTKYKDKLPKTLIVKTGSKEEHKQHFYFISKSGKTDSFKILNKTKDTLIDVQASGKQLVIPPSIHPETKKAYFILNDSPIAEIDYEEIKAIFEPLLEEKNKPEIKVKTERSQIVDEIKSKIKVSDVLSEFGSDTRKNPTQCPFHSSKGGKSLSFNDSLEVWHCFHCDESGDVFSLYMKRNNLQFKEVLNQLSKKLGLKEEDKKTRVREFKILKDDFFETYNNRGREWLVENLIPAKSMGLLFGERAGKKSLNALYLAYMLATGQPVYKKFKVTKRCRVLYVDLENDAQWIFDRRRLMKKSYGWEESPDISFITEDVLTLDADEEAFEKVISDLKPDFVIIDTWRRFTIAKENEAEKVSAFFSKIRFLILNYGCTFLFIHHKRKGMQGVRVDDLMDEVRGSGDFTAAMHFVFGQQKIKGSDDLIKIHHGKNRYGKEEHDFIVKVQFDDTGLNLTYQGEAEDQLMSEQLCANELIKILTDNMQNNFTTREAKEFMKAKHSPPVVDRALSLLVENKKISRESRGHYCFQAVKTEVVK